MTINELAKQHNITPAAIRLYEKYGLFDEKHVARRANGYREFTPLATQRLQLIKMGQLVGFSLKDMATKLKHWDDGQMSASEKKQVLSVQLQHIEQKINDLKQIQRFIQNEIAKNC